jgi:N6-L-threonylcarbamoyladenine synthase
VKVLGIETSCDETSCAVVEGRDIVGMCILSQDVHSLFGGVVPELASRAHLRTITATVDKALSESKLKIDDIDGIAVTSEPGLPGSIVVGLNFAKALAFSLDLPLIAVNHIEAHLLSPFLEFEELSFPYVGLVVSGGHTSIYFIQDLAKYKLLGRTLDDASGEVFDKIAKFVRLGYPGGPIIDRISRNIPPQIEFPKPKTGNMNFSYSGLKTCCMRTLTNWAGGIPLYEVISSFQEAVIRQLVDRASEACLKLDIKSLAVVGGVARNSRLREIFERMCSELGIKLYIPPAILCTDNAAMVAYTGWLYLENGITSPLDVESRPTGVLKASGGISK